MSTMLKSTLKAVLPKSVTDYLYRLQRRLNGITKHDAELGYWIERREIEGESLNNSHYREIMLAMAGEADDSFCRDKTIADFGCGPRGSLQWATSAKERIGIDVLADKYAQEFDLADHQMRYVRSSESTIPLPDESVDLLFTLNALDHVDDLDAIVSELLRILKPGCALIGSFNLDESPTECEPQQLTVDLLNHLVFSKLVDVQSRIETKGPPEDTYGAFLGRNVPPNDIRIMWATGIKGDQQA